MGIIVTHHIIWHRENLLSDRGKTGNLKMQFEWVPCLVITILMISELTIHLLNQSRGFHIDVLNYEGLISQNDLFFD